MLAANPPPPLWGMAPETYDGIPRADLVPKTNAGTLFGFGTSLNCQQVWSALSRSDVLTTDHATLARRAPTYPSRLQAIDTSNSRASARKNERLFCKLSLHSLVYRAATPNRCARATLYTRSAPRARFRGTGRVTTTRATASRAGRGPPACQMRRSLLQDGVTLGPESPRQQKIWKASPSS